MSWIAWGMAFLWSFTSSKTPVMEAVHIVNSCIWSAAALVLVALERSRRREAPDAH